MEGGEVIPDIDDMPRCWSRQDDWRTWVDLLGYTHTGEASICMDCTPAYRDTMVAAGRCRHPETLFLVTPGNGLTGINRENRHWHSLVHQRRKSGHLATNVLRNQLADDDAELLRHSPYTA